MVVLKLQSPEYSLLSNPLGPIVYSVLYMLFQLSQHMYDAHTYVRRMYVCLYIWVYIYMYA